MAPLLDQSAQQEAYRRSYGGSDSTAPSFIRPQYVRYNSITKSRDFGRLDNFGANLTGVVGGHSGAATLFFRLETSAITKIGIAKRAADPINDRTISVGILDGDHNPLPLSDEGFAYMAPIHNSSFTGLLDRMPPGVYYFTISTNQWRDTPFSVDVVAQRYLELKGISRLTALPRLRIALVKLAGPATGSMMASVTAVQPGQLKGFSGALIGAAVPRLSLAIMRGAAVGEMAPYGRLQQNYRIAGVATGANNNVATMTARKPYGYGY